MKIPRSAIAETKQETDRRIKAAADRIREKEAERLAKAARIHREREEKRAERLKKQKALKLQKEKAAVERKAERERLKAAKAAERKEYAELQRKAREATKAAEFATLRQHAADYAKEREAEYAEARKIKAKVHLKRARATVKRWRTKLEADIKKYLDQAKAEAAVIEDEILPEFDPHLFEFVVEQKGKRCRHIRHGTNEEMMGTIKGYRFDRRTGRIYYRILQDDGVQVHKTAGQQRTILIYN